MIRSFVAIDIPDRAARLIEARQAGLPAGRAILRENLHLTLAFLGDQSLSALGDLDTALSALAVAPFTAELSGLDVFGGPSGGVAALLVRPEPALSDLVRAVAGAARRTGMVPERRRFRLHVSLARLPRDPAAALALRLQGWIAARAHDPAIAFEPRRFTLYRSDLAPDGARHTPLAHYPIGPSGGAELFPD